MKLPTPHLPRGTRSTSRILCLILLYLVCLFGSGCYAWVGTSSVRRDSNLRSISRDSSSQFWLPKTNILRLHESSSSNRGSIDAIEDSPKEKQLPPPSTQDTVDALSSLAQTILALLSGDEAEARSLCGTAARKRELVENIFRAYGSGTLSVDEARALFVDLARSIVRKIASGSDGDHGEVARSHARRVLDADENGTNTIERVATKLLILADKNNDGRVDIQELAGMFDTFQKAQAGNVETFPKPLRALAGSLQLLPPTEGTEVTEAASKAPFWHVGVPGDDHTLRRVELEKGLSIVGLGRSADASAYFLPELGIVLDSGFHVKSLHPKTVLLTHGHRDHIGALPVHAQCNAKILAPKRISRLVRKFLIAEAQLNYGNEEQTDEETIEALGEFDILPVSDGDTILLPRSSYTGSPQPMGVEVFSAPHKNGVPAVSYGLFRSKTRLKEEFASLPKSELGALIRNDVQITESYQQGLLFYTGDTTINLLRDRYEDILPKYKHIIHEVTFLGQPSSELDLSTFQKGHTHYSQLHPWICAFPETTFVCVHWSLKYSRADVLDFFEKQYGGVPKNVVLWI